MYTIFCLIEGEDASFHVDIDGDSTVSHLKDLIKEKKPETLATVESNHLKLIHVNLEFDDSDKDEHITHANEVFQGLTKHKPLAPWRMLSEIEKGFPRGSLHILVQLPPSLKRKHSMEAINDSRAINPNLMFSASQRGSFDPHGNNIEVDLDSPFKAVIRDIKARLKAKRTIQATQRVLLEGRFPGDLCDYFEVTDGDANCSDEIFHYSSLFFRRMPGSTLTKKVASPTFEYIGSYLCKSYSSDADVAVFKDEGYWPFSLVGLIGADKYSYRPRSDLLFTLLGCPLLLIELCSDRTYESDRARLLLQAGVLVRVMNSIKPEAEQSFIAVVIYVNARWVAERYFVYQPDRGDRQIGYEQDNFPLDSPLDAFRFYFELHNLPSVFPSDTNLRGAHRRLLKMEQQVTGEHLEGFTGRKTAKHDGSNNTGRSAKSGNGRSAPFGDASILRRLSNAGYQVLQAPDTGDWVPLRPLRPTLSRAKGPTGADVMLKLVDREELEIHSFLSRVKSTCNHTISILDEFALDIGIIIAMKHELVLQKVPDSVFKMRGDDLARQFLEGVQFMHQQNVAHLDLKPDNIFLTPAHHLHIGDFGVSVLVADQESFFEGYRGTKGWVAPELKNNPDAKYRPIRADLWASGLVVLYIAQRQGAASKHPFIRLANKLLSQDPLQRPLLSKMRPFYPALESKRKAGVDASPALESKKKASVDASPAVESKKASVDASPALESKKKASVDASPALESKRKASVDARQKIKRLRL